MLSLSRVCNVLSAFTGAQPPEPKVKEEEIGSEYAKRVLRGEEAARALGLTDDLQPAEPKEGLEDGAAPAEEGEAEAGAEEGEEEWEEEEEQEGEFAPLPDEQGVEELPNDRDEGGPVGEHDEEQWQQHSETPNQTPRSVGMAGQLLEKVRLKRTFLCCPTTLVATSQPRPTPCSHASPLCARPCAGHRQPPEQRKPRGRRPGPPPAPNLRGDALGFPGHVRLLPGGPPLHPRSPCVEHTDHPPSLGQRDWAAAAGGR